MTRFAALAPLREPNFRWFYLAELVNQTGSFMNSVALAFAVLEVSNAPSALGSVLAAHSIPMVVLLLAGGVIADRFGRVLVIQVCNAGAGLTQLAIAVLVISGNPHLGQLIALTALNGVFAAASFPAWASLVPQLVPRPQLQQANALMALQRNTIRIAAPALAGVLVVTIGAGWALAFDGVTYLVSAMLLTLVRIPSQARRAGGSSAPSMLAELREGWSYVRSTTWLGVVVLAFTLINALMAGALLTLGPALAVRSSIGETGWGLSISAWAAGLLVTSVVLLRWRLERPLFLGMAAMVLLALPMIVLGLSLNLGLFLLASFLAGAGQEVFGIGWSVAMQENVPEQMLPRAYSYDALGSYLAVPAGQLAVGPVSAAVGIRPTILVAGIVTVAICLLTLCFRSVRDLQRAPITEPVASAEPLE